MGYLYSALWFIVAAVLLIRFRKESAVVYILSGYFAFAGVWWLADQLAEADMLSGIYGWILRIVSAVMLTFSFSISFWISACAPILSLP